MNGYRFHFYDEDGKIVECKWFNCNSEEEAWKKADTYAYELGYIDFELWFIQEGK